MLPQRVLHLDPLKDDKEEGEESDQVGRQAAAGGQQEDWDFAQKETAINHRSNSQTG